MSASISTHPSTQTNHLIKDRKCNGTRHLEHQVSVTPMQMKGGTSTYCKPDESRRGGPPENGNSFPSEHILAAINHALVVVVNTLHSGLDVVKGH